MAAKKSKKPVKRARSVEAKGEQRELILAAAREVVDAAGFQWFTLDKLAERCKLSKTSLYVHFSTREEILLAILQGDFQQWFGGMKQYLASADQPFGPFFPEAWIMSVSAQPRLASGMAFIHAFLEPNVSPAFALEWKRFLFREMRGLHYQLLERFDTKVSFEQFGKFLVCLTGITTGLHLQGNSNEVVNKIYDENRELAIFRSDFAGSLRLLISALLGTAEYQPLVATMIRP